MQDPDWHVQAKADEKNAIVATTDSKTSKMKDEKQKWFAAASKHFDRTGQRLTTDQARKMAEGLSTWLKIRKAFYRSARTANQAKIKIDLPSW